MPIDRCGQFNSILSMHVIFKLSKFIKHAKSIFNN